MDIVQKSLNYLKSLAAETVSHAKSGHTGSALGGSSILFALFCDHLRFDANGNRWPSRDRFVMSAGHASALFYSLLHLFGFDTTMEDLKNFRKYGSKTPGHPEFGVVCGAETTSGPLGQGVANAVGMAIAEEKMHHLFPDLISNYTYCYAGDGCLMEGVACEALSLAGTLKLKKFILLYDDNEITIDGSRSLANSEDTAKKFEAMGFNTLTVENGNDFYACSDAIKRAKTSDKPVIIIFKTIIGIGTSKEGTSAIHGYPLTEGELGELKEKLGVKESFFVPEDVYKFCRKSTEKNNKLVKNWYEKFNKVSEKFNSFFNKPVDFDGALKELQTHQGLAGRDASNLVLSHLAECTYFFGGTADLAPSTKAVINQSGFFNSQSNEGLNARNLHFGIREHGMGSVANGIALYSSNLKVFDSTFAAFSNYMLPSLKMRALMGVPVLSIFSHDSIDIGEDGPTHQPIEQIPELRQIVGLSVFRPATYAEVVAAFKHFLTAKKPTALIISKFKIFDRPNSTIAKALRGGYVLLDTDTNPTVEIIATGKEVNLALEVAENIKGLAATRVISMPCIEEFERQERGYKDKVLLKNPKLRVVIEATNERIWYKYLGSDDILVNVEDYQHSGNGEEVYQKAGFNLENITKLIKKHLKKNNG